MKLKKNRKEIHRKISLNILYGISFSLPVYGRIVPVLFALLLLNWLVEGSYIRIFPRLFKEKQRIRIISFSLIYIVYLIGLIWTTDYPYAWFDLEVKLSFLILPLIFATTEGQLISKGEFGKLIRIFALGCITVSLILYGHAFWNYIINNTPFAFYYIVLSWYLHPSYLALYMTFVISNVLYHLLIKKSVIGYWKKTAHIVILIYLMVFIILLSSKAGLLAVLMVILFYSVLFGWQNRKWGKATLFLLVSMIVFFIGLKVFPFASDRVSQAGQDIAESDSQTSAARSTSDRIGVWKAAFNIIRDHPVFGVGTGDVKNELIMEYHKQNVIPAYEQKLNAHNQYLQTFVTLGFAGFVVLTLTLLFPTISSFREQDYMYSAFLLIIILNIAFESMFETQAGVVFYAFFNVIFFSNSFYKTGDS
jgi:O-antigen ligase